jgi:hypothetical protein
MGLNRALFLSYKNNRQSHLEQGVQIENISLRKISISLPSYHSWLTSYHCYEQNLYSSLGYCPSSILTFIFYLRSDLYHSEHEQKEIFKLYHFVYARLPVLSINIFLARQELNIYSNSVCSFRNCIIQLFLF